MTTPKVYPIPHAGGSPYAPRPTPKGKPTSHLYYPCPKVVAD